jgi:hypothetical protein
VVRTLTKALVLAGLVWTATAPGALANGEVKDPCSVAAIGTLPNAYPDPTIPWLDLCDTDLAGVAGAGALRAIRATIHVAGDVGMRAGAAAYAVVTTAGACSFQIQYADRGLDVTGGATRVQGACNVVSKPCPILSDYAICFEPGPGSQNFDLRDPVAATAQLASTPMAGSTITLTFDPNKVPAGAVPPALLDALRSGGTLHSTNVISFVRGGLTAAGPDGLFESIDWAFGDQTVALG